VNPLWRFGSDGIEQSLSWIAAAGAKPRGRSAKSLRPEFDGIPGRLNFAKQSSFLSFFRTDSSHSSYLFGVVGSRGPELIFRGPAAEIQIWGSAFVAKRRAGGTR
jgi:hypothetical protein